MSSRAYDDPVMERRRLSALAQIRQLGDPVLRTPTLPVTEFDEALREEAERMASIMVEARGAGLAAPQVGSLRRLAIVQLVDGDEGEASIVPLVNPSITWRSEDEEMGVEGCLSIGEVDMEVSRAVAVTVAAQDIDGMPVEIDAEGYNARVLQHEIDHLDGVLILDRTPPEQRREALRALRDGR
ncbi:MAG: peptide deformylase [Thermoleophilia bacterium]